MADVFSIIAQEEDIKLKYREALDTLVDIFFDKVSASTKEKYLQTCYGLINQLAEDLPNLTMRGLLLEFEVIVRDWAPGYSGQYDMGRLQFITLNDSLIWYITDYYQTDQIQKFYQRHSIDWSSFCRRDNTLGFYPL